MNAPVRLASEKTMLFYVSTHNGCTIVKARTAKAAVREVSRDVGENNIREVRVATEFDISWVRGMGGRVP